MPTVADTAFLVAAFRAQESARSDALFVDPFAAELAGDVGRAMLDGAGPRGELACWSVVMRTVIIDRFITQSIEQGTRTILNLGAGLDTRPYRMALPSSVSWIEVDQSAIITHKSECLSSVTPRCGLQRVVLDVTDTAARRRLFSRWLPRDVPALVLAEGLLPYLEERDVAGLLGDLRNESVVEKLVVDCIAPAAVRARNARNADGVASVPMRFAPAIWPDFFSSHGWRVTAMRDLVDEGLRQGRPCVHGSMARGTFAYAMLDRAGPANPA